MAHAQRTWKVAFANNALQDYLNDVPVRLSHFSSPSLFISSIYVELNAPLYIQDKRKSLPFEEKLNDALERAYLGRHIDSSQKIALTVDQGASMVLL